MGVLKTDVAPFGMRLALRSLRSAKQLRGLKAPPRQSAMVSRPTKNISEIIWIPTDCGMNGSTLDVHLFQLSFLLRMVSRKWRGALQELQATILHPTLYRVARSTPNADDGWR